MTHLRKNCKILVHVYIMSFLKNSLLFFHDSPHHHSTLLLVEPERWWWLFPTHLSLLKHTTCSQTVSPPPLKDLHGENNANDDNWNDFNVWLGRVYAPWTHPPKWRMNYSLAVLRSPFHSRKRTLFPYNVTPFIPHVFHLLRKYSFWVCREENVFWWK